jgi:hypothetical protein
MSLVKSFLLPNQRGAGVEAVDVAHRGYVSPKVGTALPDEPAEPFRVFWSTPTAR